MSSKQNDTEDNESIDNGRVVENLRQPNKAVLLLQLFWLGISLAAGAYGVFVEPSLIALGVLAFGIAAAAETGS